MKDCTIITLTIEFWSEKMIIYVHGFASSGEGAKAKLFREYFKKRGEKFLAPSLSYIPELAIKTLEEMIESYDEEVKLIGSSLGGFYSMYLSNKYNLKAVLINPSIYPYKTLMGSLGEMTNYYDGSGFSWKERHFEALKNYEVSNITERNITLLVQKGDETLDYKEALAKLPNAKVIVEEGGNHGFEGIQRHFETIKNF